MVAHNVRKLESSRLHIDDQMLDKSTTQVKVVIVDPSKRVKLYSNLDDDTKSLLLSIIRKKMDICGQHFFKDQEIRGEIITPLRKTIRDDFTSYCSNNSESILQAKSPLRHLQTN